MKPKIRLLILAICLFSTASLFGQNQIRLSSDLVKVGGKLFYAHTVKQGETLYSLSKAYNTTIEQISKDNPAIASGLKAGTILYISAAAQEKASDTVAEMQDKEVEDGDKLLNQNHIQERTARKQNNNGVQERGGKRLKGKRHQVKWYEDIKDIADKYHVPAEDIIAYNGLISDKLQKRQILYIPDEEFIAERATGTQTHPSNKAEKDMAAQEDKTERLNDSFAVDSISEDAPEIRRRFTGQLEIAMLLPLNTVSEEGYSTNYMDFYAGALLAMNKLKESGERIVLNLFDTRQYASVTDIAGSARFSSNNVVIGPVVRSDLQKLSGYSREMKKPLISPMDPAGEDMIEDNKYFIQAPTHSKYQMENLVSTIAGYKNNEPKTNVVMFYQADANRDTALVREAVELCRKNGINYKEISYTILQGRNILDNIKKQLDTSMNNIALVPSNDEAFVSDVLRNLNLCTNAKYRITLFGMSKWRSYESIDTDLFHKMNLHLSLPFYIDYTRDDVKEFLLKYRALFNCEPTPYSFQGYDLTYYIASQLLKYGDSFIRGRNREKESLLQTNFEFIRENSDSGLENRATRDIIYNKDFTITLTE